MGQELEIEDCGGGVVDLLAPYGSRERFLHSCLLGPEECRFFVSGWFDLEPGTPVCAAITFAGESARFWVLSEVRSLHHHPTQPTLNGVVLSVTGLGLGPLGRAVAWARGLPEGLGRRQFPRVRLAAPVEYFGPEGRGLGRLSDVSQGGLRVETQYRRPAPGSQLFVRVMNGARVEVSLEGVVASLAFRRGLPGFGVQLKPPGSAGRAWLASVLPASP